MLENMRKQGASAFIYLIFGLLIAIFVINMGGGSGQGSNSGCGGTSNVAVTVDGKTANHTSFLVAYNSANEQLKKQQREYVAIENLIRREILGKAADQKGIRVSGDLVEDEIKKGHFFSGGQKVELPVFDTHEDGTRTWNIKKYKGWVGSLGNISLTSYQDEQTREYEAMIYASILEGSVRVSRDEAYEEWRYDNNTVTYDLVAFAPAPYRAAMRLTEDDIARFAKTHEAEVQARFKADERLYDDVKPQLKLRQIFIAKNEPEAKPAPGAGSGSGSGAGSAAGSGSGSGSAVVAGAGSGSAAKPDDKKKPGMPIADAKAKLEAIRTAAAANKAKFVEAAKDLNTDEVLKSKGGDLGWHTAADPLLDEKAVNDAVKNLKDGEMTPVITTDKGAYLILAEGAREKKLTFEQVKLEIAEELARDVWSKEKAKRDAITALENARAGTGKNLDQMFEKEPPPPMDMEHLPPEQRKMLEEMMRKQQEGHGSLIRRDDGGWTFEGKDELAGWKAGPDGAGGGSGSAAGAGSAAPTNGSAAKTGSATGSATAAKTGTTGTGSGSATGTGSATGSATVPAVGGGSATGSGSGAGSAGAPPGPGALPPDTTTLVASTDQLPMFADVEKPKVKHVAGSPRDAKMQGAPGAKEMTKVLFEELQPGMLGRRVYESDGTFVAVQLIARQEGLVTDFDKTADTEVERLRQSRARALVDGWLKHKCTQLAKDERIIPSAEIVRDGVDENGKPVPSGYSPCMYFR